MTFNLQWTGAVDHTNIATAGNWYDLDAAATAGAAPATGDSAYVIDTSDTLTGTLSSADLAYWYFGPGFQGNLGSSGVSVTLTCSSGSNAIMVYAANCQYANITAGTNGIDKLKCLGGAISLTGGTTLIVEGTLGPVTIAAGAAVTTVYGCGATFVAGYSATAFTTVRMEQGMMTTGRSVGTLTTAGNGTIVTATGIAAITTSATIHNGSRYNHQSKGTITLADCRTGATMDDVSNPYPGFIVTNANEWVGSSYFKNRHVAITATNATVPVGQAA